MRNVAASSDPSVARLETITRALQIKWVTIAWMSIEATVAIASGIVAGSVSLTAFGLDSFIEMGSAGALIWRLNWERGHECADDEAEGHHERVELMTSRFAASLLLAVSV